MAAAEKILSVKIDAQAAIKGIQELNTCLKANNVEMQALAKQGKQNSAEYITLAERSKQLAAEKRTLQKEVRNEIKAQSELDGSLKQMRAQLSNLTKEYDSLSRAERNLGSRGKELKVEINRLTNEIKDAEFATQRYCRNVGNYQNAILNAIGLNNGFARSIINITNVSNTASTTISQSFTVIGNSVKAFGKSLMALMTNPVFLAIAGIAGAGMAFKWWYDYNMGVAEALRLTREFTGLAGRELSDLRAGIQATADTYGKEYKETLQGVDTLMSHFGISAEESLKIINDGFQAGADLNGDMLAKLNQLAPAFKNAGMSADQFMALLAQTRSGIFSTQGLDAIAMATSRIRQMSDTMKKSLQGIGIDAEDMARKLATNELSPFGALTQISAKLQELSPNTQEYGKVMNDVFGKAGKMLSTEMVQGLADMSTNLDDVKGKTGEYGVEVDRLREKTEELNKAVADLFGTTADGFEVATTKAKIYAKDGLLNVVKGLQGVVKWFKNLWNSVKAVRVAVAVLTGLWRTLWRVAYAPAALVVNAIKVISNALVQLSNGLRTIRNNIASSFSGLADIFKGIVDRDPAKVAAGVAKATGGAWETVKSVTATLGKTATGVFNDIKDAGVFAAEQIGEAWSATGGIIGHTFDEIEDNISYSTEPEKILTTNNNDDITNNNNGGKGSSKGGGAGKGGNSSTGSTGNKNKDRAALAKQLIDEANRLQKQAMQEEAKLSIENIEKLYDAQKQAIIDKYTALGKLNADEQKAYDLLLQNNEDARLKALADFKEKQIKEIEAMEKEAQDRAMKLTQAMLDTTTDGSAERLKWQLEILRQQMDAELAMYEGNEQMKALIREKYEQQALDAQKSYAEQQVQIEMSKYSAMAEISGSLGDLVGAFADDSKAAAIASKTLALGQIMIAQAVAIANAVRAGSAATNPWQMIAQIAASVAAVTAAMVQAFTSLDDAKFATGGYVRGAGTSTSDSIPVRVSNGESIMNANTTAMFGGLLSSLNQLGGGVPFQVAQTAQSVNGEDMLARAVARGVAMLPNPVVSVQDINDGQRHVEVITERATL